LITCRSPLRTSLIGGGTDLPEFYERHGGAVVWTTIDRWMHVMVARRFEGDVRVRFSTTEIVPKASDVEHELGVAGGAWHWRSGGS
jgi:D-glycero-alpha-D-manno-heptose-7-phosphate kinase